MSLPANQRHIHVWKHFGPQLLKIENLFVDQLEKKDAAYLQWFEDNEKEF